MRTPVILGIVSGFLRVVIRMILWLRLPLRRIIGVVLGWLLVA